MAFQKKSTLQAVFRSFHFRSAKMLFCKQGAEAQEEDEQSINDSFGGLLRN